MSGTSSNRRRSRGRRRRGGFEPIAPITNVTLSRALLAMVVTPCLVYAWVTVRAARDMRMENVLERNLTTARLAARLLDEQCKTAIAAVRFITSRYNITTTLRSQDRASMRDDLQSMTESVPDLAYAAVYLSNGELLADYPPRKSAARNGSGSSWFRTINRGGSRYVGDVLKLEDGTRAMSLAIRLGKDSKPRGYLLAYYGLGATEQWFNQIMDGKEDGFQLRVSDKNGKLVGPIAAGGKGKNKGTPLSKNNPALQQIRGGRTQGTVTASIPREGEVWTGYSVAGIPGWAVVVSVPARTGLLASDFIILRFAALYLPVMLVMWFSVRALAGVYHRQEQMAQQLAEQNKRLMASDRTKSEFLANVSHDLWTPLAGLQLSITGLLDPKINWKEEQVTECLQLASDEVDQLTARVRNLLEMARLESDTQFSQKEPCDLADIVGSALERLRPLLKDRRVDAIFPSGPLMIECRHAQFEMVIMNLLENATKYSPPQSPLVVRGEMRGDDIYFSLRDYGPGVLQEEAERIFDKFYRGKPSRHLGGSGLGLAICKTVVEAHGGIMGVMNAPGGGAEFWFSVPALEPVKSYRRWTTQVAP